MTLYWKPIQLGETGTAAECAAVALSMPGDAPCVRPNPSPWCCAWASGAQSKLRAASVPPVCVPPPSRLTSSEKYQTSVAKKRVLTYFGHLFIFKLLLSVSVKKLL